MNLRLQNINNELVFHVFQTELKTQGRGSFGNWAISPPLRVAHAYSRSVQHWCKSINLTFNTVCRDELQFKTIWKTIDRNHNIQFHYMYSNRNTSSFEKYLKCTAKLFSQKYLQYVFEYWKSVFIQTHLRVWSLPIYWKNLKILTNTFYSSRVI